MNMSFRPSEHMGITISVHACMHDNKIIGIFTLYVQLDCYILYMHIIIVRRSMLAAGPVHHSILVVGQVLQTVLYMCVV